MTTHKTLRGPRGGMVISGLDWMKRINSTLFPGGQGGPLMHVIAAKAIALKEAAAPEFADYARRVVENAGVLAAELVERGLPIVSGGTDNHLMLVDVSPLGLTGAQAEEALHAVDITCNKNLIPFDQQPPMKTSGVRIGTAALTTRGLDTSDMRHLAGWIADILRKPADEQLALRVRGEVSACCRKHPIYS